MHQDCISLRKREAARTVIQERIRALLATTASKKCKAATMAHIRGSLNSDKMLPFSADVLDDVQQRTTSLTVSDVAQLSGQAGNNHNDICGQPRDQHQK